MSNPNSHSKSKPEPRINSDGVPHPQPIAACCANCQCGEPLPIGLDLKRRFKCRAGAAVGIAIPAANGVQIQFLRPVWPADEWCFQFTPRQNPA